MEQKEFDSRLRPIYVEDYLKRNSATRDIAEVYAEFSLSTLYFDLSNPEIRAEVARIIQDWR